MARRPRTPPDLERLWHELLKGNIYAGPIVPLRSSRDKNLLGYCLKDSGKIAIDERSTILVTVLHELLHRAYPTRSEAWVRKEEKRLIRSMCQKDLDRWWTVYCKMRRTRKRILTPCGYAWD